MKKILISSLIFLTVGFVFYLYVQLGGLSSTLNSLELLPQSEHLTELYLNNSTELPRSVKAGEVVPFSFTIHNLEGKPENYSYEVYAALPDGSLEMIASTSVMVEDGAISTINESIRFMNPPTPSEPVSVFIILPDSNLELHFMLPSTE